MANPTHLEVFFARTVRVRREHIAGDTVGEDGNLMRIVQKGESKRIQFSIAQELIIAESAFPNTKVNAEKIEAVKTEIAAEKEAEQKAKSKLQKAA